MRFFEIASGLRVPVSAEEQELINRIIEQKAKRIAGQKLEERQLQLAREMVSRGLLNRRIEDNVVYYEANGLPDLWRF